MAATTRTRRTRRAALAVVLMGTALASSGCIIGPGYSNGGALCYPSIGTDWTPNYPGQPAPTISPIIDGFLYNLCFAYN